MSSNLPPGVTDSMIEAQVLEEVEAEATCPNGHRAVHGGYPEERMFRVPICDQRLTTDDVDPPEGVGQVWDIEYHEEGREQAVCVLGYHLECDQLMQAPLSGCCNAEWWVAAPLAEVERWEAALAAEQAADEAMERAQLDDHHLEHCKHGQDSHADNPAYPGLLFSTLGTVCGRWEGPVGVEVYLQAEGVYQPGYTGNPQALAGVDIDERVAAATPCPLCGKTGARFEAWANQSGHYGVGVAICQCGHASTF